MANLYLLRARTAFLRQWNTLVVNVGPIYYKTRWHFGGQFCHRPQTVQETIITARCTIAQSAVLRSHVVCPSVRLSICLFVTLVDHCHIGWKSWKLIARTINPTSLLFVAQRSSTYSQGNMKKFWGENVRSTSTSITSGWIESIESHVITWLEVWLFVVCLLLRRIAR